jgi:preprotein translocase subunit SecA
MEDLRQEIGMQAIAQRDPLTEYQRNAFGMFEDLKRNIQRDIVYQIIPVSFQYEVYMRQVLAEQQQRLQVAQHAGESVEQAKAARTVRKPSAAKIGRNDMCPCGSGKKFKHCHEGREGELFALLQARGKAESSAGQGAGPQAQPAPSVSAQLATGRAGVAHSAAPRGRAAPPATPAAPANGKNGKSGKSGKVQPQAQRGKGPKK